MQTIPNKFLESAWKKLHSAAGAFPAEADGNVWGATWRLIPKRLQK